MLLLTNEAGTRINPLGDQFSCGRAGLRPKAFPHLLAVPPPPPGPPPHHPGFITVCYLRPSCCGEMSAVLSNNFAFNHLCLKSDLRSSSLEPLSCLFPFPNIYRFLKESTAAVCALPLL